MDKEQQIQIIQDLIDGVIELNGEYQTYGWEDEIEEGQQLIKYLKDGKRDD